MTLRLLTAFAGLALLAWCSPAVDPDAGRAKPLRPIDGRLTTAWRDDPLFAVYHDDARRVTCWTVLLAREPGISCLPDSQLSAK